MLRFTPEAAIGLLMVAAVALLLYVSKMEHDERERLVAACMADGHKEYECRSPRSTCTTLPPVIISR